MESAQVFKKENLDKIIEIFNLTQEEFVKDETLQRVLKDEQFNVEYNLDCILNYLLKKYGCRNKKLQDYLQSSRMEKYGWGILSGNYTPAFGRISISPKAAIKKDVPVFYVRSHWTTHSGTMIRYHYSVNLFPLKGENINDIIDTNLKGNLTVYKKENYVNVYICH